MSWEKKKDLVTIFDSVMISTVEMLHTEVQSLCNFSFLEIAKKKPATAVRYFFL
jgi:hypothetical protein